MIPKKIHYIWLGKKEPDNTSKMCINSCRRNCPDYEIIIWNENNLDLDKLKRENKFLKKCIEIGLWAFASDYLRLYLLYQEGGIYLDTDVEVLHSFDSFLDYVFFVGMESSEYIGTGVIGSEAGSKELKRLLEFYDKGIWDVDFFNNPMIFNHLFEKEPGTFNNAKIFPVDIFSPYSPQEEGSYLCLIGNEKTMCIHWYNAAWGMSRKGYVFLQTKHVKNPFERLYQVLRKNIGYFRKKRIYQRKGKN